MENNNTITNHIGETHGIYTIVDVTNETNKYGIVLYKCVCNECGFEKTATYGGISAPSNIVTKCKHVRADGNYINPLHVWKNERIRQIFNDMIKRCYDPNHKDYRWYGAKNIDVCKEWRNNSLLFEEWALQNGYSDNLTIDRIQSNQGYYPENCRWISLEENSRRAGKVTWLTVNGITLTGRQWSKRLDLGINRINTYVRKYGTDKVKELIGAMLDNPPHNKTKNRNQSWFQVYNIQI